MSNTELITQTQAPLDRALEGLDDAEHKRRDAADNERRTREEVIARSNDCKQLIQAIATLEGTPVPDGGDLNAALIKAKNVRRRSAR